MGLIQRIPCDLSKFLFYEFLFLSLSETKKSESHRSNEQ